MKCGSCGNTYEGNFCPDCGAPAPQKVTCQSCGAEFEGVFCNNCGVKYKEPIETRCRNLRDKSGVLIDVDRLAGVYLSAHELRGYFKKCTDYSQEEIDELVGYIDEYIDGNDYNFFEAAAEKRKIESQSSEPKKSATEILFGSAAIATPAIRQRPQTKRERINENKRNGVACCPKCGSSSLSANKKGFSFIKGSIGGGLGALILPVGAVAGLGAGNIGSHKVVITCLNCGHQWKP